MANQARVAPEACCPVVVIVLWRLLASAGLLQYEYLPAPLEVIRHWWSWLRPVSWPMTSSTR